MLSWNYSRLDGSDSLTAFPARCAIAVTPGFEARGQKLAGQLHLPLIQYPNTEKPPQQAAFPCLLLVDQYGLGLQLTGADAPGAVRCDFVTGSLAHRRKFGGGRKQDLPRAIGLDKRADLHVLDMTAGLGRDAFVLAGLGATVTMLERNPVIHALLADGLQRASQYAEQGDSQLLAIIQRMKLFHDNAMAWSDSLNEGPQADVIYLDPMFPARQKSAKVKKEMQAFHVLVGEDNDAGQLLPLALRQARYRVVVKRPVQAPVLAGKELADKELAGMAPSYAYTGKSTRYDIYSKCAIKS